MTSTEAPKFGCNACGGQESRVVNSRPLTSGEGIRRRRVCIECGRRFSTIEVIRVVEQRKNHAKY